ncbi:PQQ-binding-like beta-propeller repeat protein [Kitasatospora aureofaciens]|uniref:protein kinase domain-containing protein n=1 Tax=Kitasatospora aureofaciens TaxID=1894 RepID=UPI001C47F314|nr:PQQ-binding-like beta-propeller repeat protein [Kitasatospora aureofaciens]MBV6697602.1 PQQ-binding-like beta-propeller repeat protein [Kitasatospora aureofaciens]
MRQLDPTDPPRIGPYALLGRLGAGGMGVVYLGRSTGGRTVAVKLVRAELAGDQSFRARFRHEVRAARAASSAFTAPVVDADPDGPIPWLATAFVPGIGLDEAVMLVGPFPEHVLRILASGIAEELGNIHAARLTHRDLKPSNVLLALDGPHVIDFGIARAADGTVLTAEGAIFGTPAYMSPEQALGRTVSPASDVFSLGATLVYAASGGRGPFDGGHSLAVLQKVANEEPDLSAVPGGLRLLVAACLAKDPADRPTPRQVMESLAGEAGPLVQGPWLHPMLVTAIEKAAAVLAPSAAPPVPPPPAPSAPPHDAPPAPPSGLPYDAPPPAGPPYDAPPVPPYDAPRDATGQPTVHLRRPEPALVAAPESAPELRPSRRKLLLGLAGGAVAAAGGGTALYFGLPSSGKSSGNQQQPQAAPTPAPTDLTRPIDTKVAATPLWTVQLDDPAVQLVGEGDTVLVAGMKGVRAFDKTGKPVWGPLSNYLARSWVGGGASAMAVGGGKAYIGGLNSQTDLDFSLKAVDLATGNVAWKIAGPHYSLQSASVAGLLGGIVYVHGDRTVTSTSGNPSSPFEYHQAAFVWAVDPATRAIRWETTYQHTTPIFGQLLVPSSGTRLLWNTASADRTLSKLAALDVNDGGKTVWEQPAPGAGATLTSLTYLPAFSDGPHSSAGGDFLFLTDRLYALDSAGGTVAWKSPGQLGFQSAAANPDGTVVYAAGQAPDKDVVAVQAFDAKSGQVRWSGSLQYGSVGNIAVFCVDGNVYVWTRGRVWALDPDTGNARWTFDFQPSTETATSVPFWAGGGRVYGPTDKGLTALAADGKPARSQSAPSVGASG